MRKDKERSRFRSVRPRKGREMDEEIDLSFIIRMDKKN
jgi:hypothetical protein